MQISPEQQPNPDHDPLCEKRLRSLVNRRCYPVTDSPPERATDSQQTWIRQGREWLARENRPDNPSGLGDGHDG